MTSSDLLDGYDPFHQATAPHEWDILAHAGQHCPVSATTPRTDPGVTLLKQITNVRRPDGFDVCYETGTVHGPAELRLTFDKVVT